MEQHYSDDNFWSKIYAVFKKAGSYVIELALTLYYTLIDSETPATAKTAIIGALGYFIFPFDVIPDFLPGGYTDDIGLLLGVISLVSEYIKTEHKQKAKEKIEELF